MPPVPAALPTDLNLPAHLRAAAEQAAGYARQAAASNTRRAYSSDWADWALWCAAAGLDPMPATPAALGIYLAERAGQLSVATVSRRLAAISTAHRQAGLHLDTRQPAVRDVMKGIRRAHGTEPRRARPATTPIVLSLIATCDQSLLGLRDRALLLLGYASALRRSELVALEISDLGFTDDGVRLTVRHSKTDTEGAGQQVGVVATGTPTCPVAALRHWLAAAGITEGRVFRAVDRHGRMAARLSGEAVALIIQRRALLAGIDPAGLSGHSLRAGLATTAASLGAAESDIQRQTRHRSVVVLRGYVRLGSIFTRNVSASIGL